MVLIFAHLYFSGSSVALHQLADEFSPIGRQLPPPSSLHAHISSRAMPLHSQMEASLGEGPMAKPTSVSRMRSTRKTPEESIRGQPFRHADFMNICTYLESPQHYNTLFGIGPITPVGTANRSKVTAYNIFADWMNERNPALQLTGRGLSHRLTSYKRLYTNAKNHEDPSCNEVDKGHRKDSHTEILEQLCPCFERMDHIFGNQVDISPILLSDQPLRDSGIITVTNWLAGHTFLSLAKVFLVLAFIILLTTHIPLSFWYGCYGLRREKQCLREFGREGLTSSAGAPTTTSCPHQCVTAFLLQPGRFPQQLDRRYERRFTKTEQDKTPQQSFTSIKLNQGNPFAWSGLLKHPHPSCSLVLIRLTRVDLAIISYSQIAHYTRTSANLPDIALTQDHTNPVGHG
ncbi:hypothetical protein Pst134EB_004368 [Puccinia striiformis f. sp. tritici]|nr:hypothetical protein Pst134EB_004368 [Puccinia striiformis f. sp. tritici]